MPENVYFRRSVSGVIGAMEHGYSETSLEVMVWSSMNKALFKYCAYFVYGGMVKSRFLRMTSLCFTSGQSY